MVRHQRQARGKNQARGVNAACGRHALEVLLGIGRCHDPEYAAADFAEQVQPEVEYFGTDLGDLIERTEHHPCFGQAVSSARLRRGDAALAVVGLIAVGQARDLLGIKIFRAGGNQKTIRDDVIDEVGAHGARIAVPVHLQRGHAFREQRTERVLGISLQIDQDVWLQRADAFTHGVVG